MNEQEKYLLGYRAAEQDRLERQALELAADAAWLFDQIGVRAGMAVVEIGCGPRGCLDLLADLVGASGSVTGIERGEDAVARANEFVASRGLANVAVHVGDGRSTGLPREGFDLVTSRLVLVNVPQPDELVTEAVALAKPGGTVAFHEAVWPLHTCDPPLQAWDELYSVFRTYAELNGIDLFIGTRLPRLLREHGLTDIKTNAISQVYPVDHGRRMLAVDFVDNLGARFVEQGLIETDELAARTAELRQHLADPNTFVISCLFVQGWGTKPA